MLLPVSGATHFEQTRAEQLAAQLESGSLGIDYNEATRSPSPPPVYDSFGHRMRGQHICFFQITACQINK